MVDGQKLVLIIQPNRLQGLIWQTVLKSQKISVIQESPDNDLSQSLSELKTAGLTLPNLLLIDINQLGFNPYSFCRWCRKTHPEVSVVLTNSTQADISPPERQWALNQGAADLLAGFQTDNLVSSVAAGTRRLLDILECLEFDNAALISTLLKMKRELDARRAKEANGAIANSTPSVADVAPEEPSAPQPSSSPAFNGNEAPAVPATPEPDPPPQPKIRRRYRGIVY